MVRPAACTIPALGRSTSPPGSTLRLYWAPDDLTTSANWSPGPITYSSGLTGTSKPRAGMAGRMPAVESGGAGVGVVSVGPGVGDSGRRPDGGVSSCAGAAVVTNMIQIM